MNAQFSGVGTVTPTHALHVNDPAGDPVRFENLQSRTAPADSTLLVADPATGVVRYLHIDSLTSINSSPWFNVATNAPASANTDNVYITGNVAIGNASPTEALDVQGNVMLNEGELIFSSANNSATDKVSIDGSSSDLEFYADRYFDFIESDGNTVAVRINANDGNLEVTNRITTDNFTMTNGATNGYLLQSNATGAAAWVDPSTVFTDTDTDEQDLSLSGNNLNITNGTGVDLSAFAPDGDAWGVTGEDIASDISRTGDVTIRNTNKTALTIQTSANASSNGIAFQNAGGNYTWAISREPNASDDADAELVFSGGLNSGNVNTLAERMRLDQLGRLGLNTNDPSARLDVNGDARIRTLTGGAATDVVVTADTDGNLRSRTAAEVITAGGGVTDNIYSADGTLAGNRAVALATNDLNFDANTLVVSGDDDRVGIGTANPTSVLTVGDNINHDEAFGYPNAQMTIFDSNNNGGNTPNGTRDILNLVREGVASQALGNKVAFSIGRYANTGIDARTQFDIKLNEGSFNGDRTVMSLRSNGNTGIGTTAPTTKLDVNGNARIRTLTGGAAADVVVTADADGNLRSRTAAEVITAGGGVTDNIYSADGTLAGNRAVAFGTNDLNFDANTLVVSGDDDRVGIGTATPISKLHVVRPGIDATSGLHVAVFEGDDSGVNNNQGAIVGFKTANADGDNNVNVGIGSRREETTAAVSSFHIMLREDASNVTFEDSKLSVLANGNVGIGTRTPDALLDVEGGTVRFSDYGNNAITGTATSILGVEGDGDLVEVSTSSLSENLYNANGTLTENRAVTQNNFDLNFDANTLVVSGDDDRVGIGTANPFLALDVNGSIRVAGNGTADEQGLQLIWNDANVGGTSQGISGFLNHRGLGPGGFVWSQTNDNVNFTEFMRLTASGNLGIGTTSPGAKLGVAGRTVTTDFTMTNGATNGYVLQSDATGVATWVDPTTISAANIYNTDGSLTANRAVTQGSFDLNFDANTLVVSGDDNRVGIGTATPAYKLTINTTTSNQINFDQGGTGPRMAFSEDNGVSTEAAIQFRNSSAPPANYPNSLAVFTSGTNDLWFNANPGSPDVWIEGDNGNVGIGTTTPSSLLDVAGRTTTEDFTMTNGAANGYVLQSDATGVATWVAPTSVFTDTDDQTLSWASGTNTLSIADGNSVDLSSLAVGDNLGNHTAITNVQLNGNWLSGDGGNEGIFVDAAGNVGVGTASPGTRLEIVAPVGQSIVRIAEPGSIGGSIQLGNVRHGVKRGYAGADNDVGLFTSSGNIHLSTNNNTSESTGEFILTDAGNVGIGTTTPSSRLDVAGRTTTQDFTMTTGAANGYVLQSNAAGDATWVDPTTISAANIYNTDGSLTANRAVTQGSFDLNFDANTLVVSGDDNRVGIGTASPSFALDVNGSARIAGNGTANAQGLQLTWNDANIGGTSQGISGFLNHRGLGPGGFVWSQTNDNVNFTEFMRLTASGNLGIGTTSPGAKLGVAGRTVTTDFTMTNGATNGYVLQSDATGIATWVDPTNISAANLYNTDGTLTGNRAIATGGNNLNITGLTAGTNAFEIDGGRIGMSVEGAHGVMTSIANTVFIANSNNGPITTGSDPSIGDGNFVWGVGDESSAGVNYIERMRLTQTGLLGIGTASPASLLDVNGRTTTTNFTMTNGAASGYLLQSNATGVAAWVDPSTVFTDTDTDEQDLSLSGNNLNITNGTGVDLSAFAPDGDAWGVTGEDIASGISRTGDVTIRNTNKTALTIQTSANASSNGIAFQNTGGNYTWAISREPNASDDADAELVFSGGLNSGDVNTLAERMRIDQLGRLGLNTNDPSARLDVDGNARIRTLSGGAATDVVVTADADGNLRSRTAAEVITAGGGMTDNIYSANGTLAGNRSVAFGANDLNFDANTLVVSGDDNFVGIGTSSPTEKLQVSNGLIYVNGEGSGLIVDNLNKRVGLMKYSGKEAGIWRTAAQDFEIGRITGGAGSTDVSGVAGNTYTTDFYVADDGNVGIGIVTPISTLDVNGTITARNGIGNSDTVGSQIEFAWSGGSSTDYRHAIKTRHNGAADENNAIDFYIWDLGVDALGDEPTLRVLTIDGDNDGEVGIGTGTPSSTLDVAGRTTTEDFTMSSGATNGYVLQSNATGVATWVDPATLAVTGDNLGNHTATTNLDMNSRDIVFTTGNQSMPTGNLDFGSTTRQMVNLWGGAGEFGIGVQSSTQYFRSNNNFAWFQGGTHSNATFDPGAGGTALMVLNNSGNLGIGTTNPTELLQVTGPDALVLVGDAAAGRGGIHFGNASHGVKRDYNGTGNDVGLYTTSGNLHLSTNNEATGEFILTNAGNVGIGTAAPSHRVHAVNTTDSDGFLFENDDDTTGEKDVFTILDKDSGGGSQDHSSSFKVHRSGNIAAAATGQSLVELTYTGADSGEGEYYIAGRKVDEGAPLWGVDLTDNEIWTSGGITAGVTGNANGSHSSGSFIVLPTGEIGVSVGTPTESIDVSGTARLRGLADDTNPAHKLVVADANGVLHTTSQSSLPENSAIRVVTSATSVSATDATILVNAASGSVTLTLPTPVAGRKLIIKKIDNSANNVIIDGAGANIDGSASRSFSVPYQSFTLQTEGTAWYILN